MYGIQHKILSAFPLARVHKVKLATRRIARAVRCNAVSRVQAPVAASGAIFSESQMNLAQPRNLNATKKGGRGFTLLEVMVVVVILGILAALVVPKIISRPDEARIIATKQDIASLMQTLKLYRLDNQRYPTTEQGLQALVLKPTASPVPPNWKSGGYIERLPKDPWGNPYQYLNPGVRGEIDVYSFGADGAPGGEGNDADIGSWIL